MKQKKHTLPPVEHFRGPENPVEWNVDQPGLFFGTDPYGHKSHICIQEQEDGVMFAMPWTGPGDYHEITLPVEQAKRLMESLETIYGKEPMEQDSIDEDIER
jgi:hypothetical protein